MNTPYDRALYVVHEQRVALILEALGMAHLELVARCSIDAGPNLDPGRASYFEAQIEVLDALIANLPAIPQISDAHVSAQGLIVDFTQALFHFYGISGEPGDNSPAPRPQIMDLSSDIPPANIGAEQVVLGALLHSGVNDGDGSSALRPEDCADPVHSAILRAIIAHNGERPRLNIHAIAAEAAAECADLSEIGGVGYLQHIAGFGINATPGQVLHGINVIRDAECRRGLLDIAEHLRALASDTSAVGFETPGSDAAAMKHAAYLRARLLALAEQVQTDPDDTSRRAGNQPNNAERSFLTSCGSTSTNAKIPTSGVSVCLSTNEMVLLADAVERKARVHDQQRGSCPDDLHGALQRADELRAMAGTF